ncbi:ECF transporter S component [Ureibacillus manganicus]|nr:ECF transporter S component [Ureibacillus manganicus]
MEDKNLQLRSTMQIRQSTRVMTIIACLAALSIVGRIYTVGIPNVQPSTTIIICVSLVFGIKVGLTLAIITVFGSNLVLGFGPFLIMQLIAWGSVAVVSGLIGKIYKKIPFFILALYSALMGMFFGLMVSLNMLFIGDGLMFVAYYLAGIPFDIYHAIGNFFFFLVLGPIIIKIMEKEKKKLFR